MSEVLRLCRQVLRELQKIDPQARTGQLWRYVRAEVTNTTTNNVTAKKLSQSLQTCASYLESSRQHRDLLVQYGGRGERSVQEAAHLVGLELPQNTLKEDTQRDASRTNS